MSLRLEPIGYVRTNGEKPPRSWRTSDLTGEFVVNEDFEKGLAGLEVGDRIVVLFHFHESPEFSTEFLRQRPRSAGGEERGVFSTLSPVRPNPVGMSIVRVLEVWGTTLRVRGLDMRDGTPILDIKPWPGDVAGTPTFEG